MEFTLLQFGIILLLFALSFRVAFVITPIVHFVRLFGKKSIEAQKQIRGLEIPGVAEFFRREIFLMFLSYVSLTLVTVFFDLSTIEISEISIFYLILLFFFSFIWFLFELYRSWVLRKNLTKLVEETSRLQFVAGKAVDVAQFFVVNSLNPTRIVRRQGLKFLVGFFKRRTKSSDSATEHEGQNDKSVINRILGNVETALSLPEKTAKRVSNHIKNEYNTVLSRSFEKHIRMSKMRFTMQILISILPGVMLLIFSRLT